MKTLKSIAALFLLLSSIAFISCEKEGRPEDEKVQEEVKEIMFKANIKVSEDLVKACKSIKFEYYDAEGKLVAEDVDFSKLPTEKYPFNNKEYNVHVWKKEFKYSNKPAESYFKPILTKDPDYKSDVEPNFIYDQYVSVAGRQFERVLYKLGVDIDVIQTILDSIISTVNK